MRGWILGAARPLEQARNEPRVEKTRLVSDRRVIAELPGPANLSPAPVSLHPCVVWVAGQGFADQETLVAAFRADWVSGEAGGSSPGHGVQPNDRASTDRNAAWLAICTSSFMPTSRKVCWRRRRNGAAALMTYRSPLNACANMDCSNLPSKDVSCPCPSSNCSTSASIILSWDTQYS